jgi:hypothetical protein
VLFIKEALDAGASSSTSAATGMGAVILNGQVALNDNIFYSKNGRVVSGTRSFRKLRFLFDLTVRSDDRTKKGFKIWMCTKK